MKKFTFRRVFTAVIALFLAFTLLAADVQPIVVYAAGGSSSVTNPTNPANPANPTTPTKRSLRDLFHFKKKDPKP